MAEKELSTKEALLKGATPGEVITDYHRRTSHLPDRYAKSAGFLDWANEPDPFRSFSGARVIPFSTDVPEPDGSYSSLYGPVPGRGFAEARDITLDSVGTFLGLSFGLSAWKVLGDTKWPLRINPSSGNLHPTEVHLILPPLEGLEGDGLEGGGGVVAHYSPYSHGLEVRAEVGEELTEGLFKSLSGDGGGGVEGFLVGLTSVYWRESWKYGERAFRYCNHDIGHGAGAIAYAASLQGWKVTALTGTSGDDSRLLFGLDKVEWLLDEEEEFECLFYIHRGEGGVREVDKGICASFGLLDYKGVPNRLSEVHEDWSVIEEVSGVTQQAGYAVPEEAGGVVSGDRASGPEGGYPEGSGASLLRSRRSGQNFDPSTSMTKEAFYSILVRTLPGSNQFSSGLTGCEINLAIFVHRVDGLAPGLYMLMRDQSKEALEGMKSRTHMYFKWEGVEGAPEVLSLYSLFEGDLMGEAQFISCQQAIAGESHFSLAMIGNFKGIIDKDPHAYRRLFWEAGLIGQTLYIEAEAHGVRGTGIGCYYDEVMHHFLGLTDMTYQSMYHFTVGFPLEDRRLTTLPPYGHLEEGQL